METASSKITGFQSDQECIIKLGTFNVANAVTDEKSETTNFFVREEAVLKTIKDMNCDVLVINELRPYMNRTDSSQCQPVTFLGKLPQYAHVYDYMNGSPLSFGNAILYKRDVVYPVKTVKYWLSETPEVPSDSWGNGFGRILMGIKFYPMLSPDKINLGAKPFWVYAVHLGLGESEKAECAKLIPKLVRKDAGEDHFAILGDFNFFDDRDGKKHRQIMVDSGLSDAGAVSFLSCMPLTRCYGTFLGFEKDDFKSSYEVLMGFTHADSELGSEKYGFNATMPSRLDHGFVSDHTEISDARVWVESIKQLIDRTTPSDHLPFFFKIKL
jgi:endonuclease/exonuclease/phosphatase family metal-dependent hydrolase